MERTLVRAARLPPQREAIPLHLDLEGVGAACVMPSRILCKWNRRCQTW